MAEVSSVPSYHERGDNSPEMKSLMTEKESQPKQQPSLYHRLFNDIRFFTFCYCITNLLSNTVIVYVVSQITALEREFHLSSSQTGFLVSSMDLGVFTTTIVIGYFADKVHIPKVLAITTLVFGITALDSSLPHFIFGTSDADYSNDSISEGNLSQIHAHLCQDSNVSMREQCSQATQEDVHTEAIESTISFWMVVMGCVFNGVALAPRYPFFVTFIDSNTDKSKSGFLIGLTQTAVVIGGVTAFAFSSVFSNFHVTLQEVDISPLHPRWIGAWWLGFIIFGILCISSAIPLFFFPRKFDNEATDETDAKEVKDKDVAAKLLGSEKNGNKEGKDQEKSSKLSILGHVKAYFRIVWHLFKNPVYVFTELSSICAIFATAGAGAFLPKYMELQFMVPAWQANIFTSGIMLCSASGTLLGGWITARSSMTPTRNLKLSIIIVAISLALDCCVFFLACDYYDFTDALKNQSDCGMNCNCDLSIYSPVCGDDRHYLSPCAAGCVVQDELVYRNCSCIESGITTEELCSRDCTLYIVLFIIVKIFNGIAISMASITIFIMLIRSVDDNEKSMAVGLAEFFNSILAWLPGPIVFGKLVDRVCMIWDSSCNSVGSCLLYSLPDFRYVFNGLICGFEMASVIFLTITLYFRIRLDKRNAEKESRVEMEVEIPYETESPPL